MGSIARKFCGILGLLGLMTVFLELEAQDVNKPNLSPDFNKILPQAHFSRRVLGLGDTIRYTLSLERPESVQVLFPDTSYDFQPFELVDKKFFPTQSQNRLSKDSAVYWLRSFKIDSVKTLSLPIYALYKGDSIPLYPVNDTIFFQSMMEGKEEVAELEYRSYSETVSLNKYFNYPVLIMSILGGFLLVLIIWGLLGNQIQRYYFLFQFRTRHRIFIAEFSRLITRIENRENPEDIEKAISIWKKHMEFLEEKPFSTFTSKEIGKAIPDQDLLNSLKSIDRAIYGREFSEQLKPSLSVLKNISIERYEKRQMNLRET